MTKLKIVTNGEINKAGKNVKYLCLKFFLEGNRLLLIEGNRYIVTNFNRRKEKCQIKSTQHSGRLAVVCGRYGSETGCNDTSVRTA